MPNGTRRSPFAFRLGKRSGDPTSPVLFEEETQPWPSGGRLIRRRSLASSSEGAPAAPTSWGFIVIKRVVWWLIGAAALVGLVLMIAHFDSFRHWLAVHTGTVNESGPYYGFWSGFGSDLGEATLIGAVSVGVYTGVRKVNCHTKGCWRIGHHQLEGTPYHLCKHHHPDVPTKGASIEHILSAHQTYKDAQSASSDGPATTPPPS